MRYLAAHTLMGDGLSWQDMGQMGARDEPGVTITFSFVSRLSHREALKSISQSLREQDEVTWLYERKGNWYFDADEFKADVTDLKDEDWLTSIVIVEPEVENVREKIFDREQERTYCRFVVTPEMITDQLPKRIFLSHKGVDKPLVRRLKVALEVVGLRPWLDEDELYAGVERERGLLAGFKESCAAVFFVTPSFVDEGFLASEIDLAISEKRRKGDRFTIITLLLADAKGARGKVPDLLERYIWQEPDDELGAFVHIVKALPLSVAEIGWKR